MASATISNSGGPGSTIQLAPETIRVRDAVIARCENQTLEQMNEFVKSLLQPNIYCRFYDHEPSSSCLRWRWRLFNFASSESKCSDNADKQLKQFEQFKQFKQFKQFDLCGRQLSSIQHIQRLLRCATHRHRR